MLLHRGQPRQRQTLPGVQVRFVVVVVFVVVFVVVVFVVFVIVVGVVVVVALR